MPPRKRQCIGQVNPKARRTKIMRANETPEEREARLEQNRLRTAAYKIMKTPEHRIERLKEKRIRTATSRSYETAEQRETRIENNRRNTTVKRKQASSTMPKKDPWKYKKRRKTKRNSKVEGECNENSRFLDPGEIQIYSLSSEILCQPIKKEVIYPDIRFTHSTTLFPAKGILISSAANNISQEKTCDSLKRGSDDDTLTTPSKKCCPYNLPIADDECIIIPKPQVKVELIDLTDDSCHDIEANVEQNKARKNNPEVNIHQVDINKDIDLHADILAHNQVKTEKRMQNESNNEVSYNEATVKLLLDNYIQIEVDQNKSSENNFRKPPMAVSNTSENKINIDRCYVDNSKYINQSTYNHAHIQEQTVSNNEVSFNEDTFVPLLDNHVQIKAEQSKSSKINFQNSNFVGSNTSENNINMYRSHVDIHPSIANPNYDFIQVKTEQNNEVNFNDGTFELHLESHIQINPEQRNNLEEYESPTLQTP